VSLRVAAMVAAGAVGLLGILVSPHPAAAKSALWEIASQCPCAGPTARSFWTSRDERMACVDAVIDELRATWPDEILVRDRARELRSRCGNPRFQCDGTGARQCPRGTVCEAMDPFCDATGVASVCVSRRKLRKLHGCKYEPPACGCNGKTYATACHLWRRGATLAHGGTCANGCAGPDRIACGPGTYCAGLLDCGDGGAWGQCLPVGECFDVVSGPVCGCDGTTYASVCSAAANGTWIRYHAPCEDAE
jgi:hypothetical protein